MEYFETHGPYMELVSTGHQIIYTKDINKDNIDIHFDSITSLIS